MDLAELVDVADVDGAAIADHGLKRLAEYELLNASACEDLTMLGGWIA